MPAGRIALALLLAAPAAASAQDACADCGGSGVVACRRHGDPRLEEGTVWCSVVAACRACRGAGVVACGACTAEPRPSLAQRIAGAAAVRARRARDFDGLADDLVQVRGAFVDVALQWPRGLQVDGERLDEHELAHAIVRRVEAMRADFCAVFGLGPDDFPRDDGRTTSAPDRLAAPPASARLELVLVRDRALAHRLAPLRTGIDLSGLAVLARGGRSAACVHVDPREVPDADALDRLCAHVAARLLVAQIAPHRSPGELGFGFVEAGVAHWFEARHGDGVSAFVGFGDAVLRRVAPLARAERWSAVARLADAGRLRSFAELAALQHEELDLEAHAQAGALVAFLVDDVGGPALLGAVREVLDGGDAVRVFEALHGQQPGPLDQRFRDWLRVR